MLTERRAFYPGSFDPPTKGHVWVIDKMSEQYDHGIVSVGINPDKASGRFSISQRLEMLQEISKNYPNISVTSFAGLLQVDYAEMIGAKYIIRGTRNSADFSYETDIRHVNNTINPNIETVVFIPPKELLQVSSSMVMSLVGFEGWESEVSKMVPPSVFQKISERQQLKDKEMLSGRWQELLQRLGAKDDSLTVFNLLYQKWSEPHRKYHGVSHLKMCLNELASAKHLSNNPDALEFSLWFHDAFQETSKGPNGEKIDDEISSADLAAATAKQMGLGEDFINKVTNIILATKHKNAASDFDAQLMADIDLAIFGRSLRLFMLYEQGVKNEYSWVHPEEVYKKERAKILSTFLPPYRKFIYQSQFFREKYEQRAKENLASLINGLQTT